MKLAIMQPYIFPYIGYFQLMNAVDKFVLYDDVNYINRGWINRNRLLVNGKEHLFTIPLKDASQNKLIKDISLSADQKWKNKLLKTIQLNYKKAPCYEEVLSLVEKIIFFETNDLTAFIYNSLELTCQYLKITTPLERTSTIYNNQHLKGQHRILDICKQEAVQEYINPIGGIEIYDRSLFDSNNIKLHFIKSDNISYSQFDNNFVPWLSIIDVMMFNTSQNIQNYLNLYKLI
jgi:hypothetical protein